MVEQILTELDNHLSRNDYISAEKHLLAHLEKAKSNNDNKIVLLISNELMGLYRKLGNREKSLEYVNNALNTVTAMGIEKNIGAATTYLNCGTVHKAFGMAEKSLDFFRQAQAIYEKSLNPDDKRFGGLYNNMALTLVDLKKFEEADFYYNKALNVMENQQNGEPERAITYLNMASGIEAKLGIENGSEEIAILIEKAMELLNNSPDTESGNYAFVCEKCAPIFGYYGYFLYENTLKERARRIYERT